MSGITGPSMTGNTAATTEFRIGHVFGRSFELLTRRFPVFLALSAAGNLPVILVHLALGSTQSPDTGLASGLSSVLVGLISGPLAMAAIVYVVVQELRGEPPSMGQAVRVALGRAFPLIAVSFLSALLAGLASILLIVPGLMVMCAYYVCQPACLVERKGVMESLSRSGDLTRGRRWSVFGLLLLTALLLGGAIFLLAFVLVSTGIGETTQTLITDLWTVLVGSYTYILPAVLYFHLRTVKEGLDLDGIARVFE